LGERALQPELQVQVQISQAPPGRLARLPRPLAPRVTRASPPQYKA